MNCCVQASIANLKHLGQNTLSRAILHACVGVTLAQPTEEQQQKKKTTTWNKPRMEIGKNIFHLYASTMPCSHAIGTQFVRNSCAKHFLSKKKKLQHTELHYRTVTSTSTDHLKFKATFVDNTVPNAYRILSDLPLPS